MKRVITKTFFSTAVLVFMFLSAQAQNFKWAKQYTDKQPFYDMLDDGQHVFVTGYGMFLAELDHNGNAIWVKNPSKYFNGFFVKKDAANNLYVAGNFNGGATITTTSGDVNLQSNDGDVFLAKFNQQGDIIWIRQSKSSNAAYINGLELDKSGNPVISGYFFKTLGFSSDSLISRGDKDIFVAKYDASGNFSWLKQIGGTAADAPSCMTATPSGMIIMAGLYNDNAQFDKQVAPANNGSVGYITELDPQNGSFHWIQTDPKVFVNLISTADKQNYYVNVVFTGTLTAGSHSITTPGLAGAVIKMDTAFNRLSVYSCEVLPGCMAVQQNGSLVMGGSFEVSITLGGKKYNSYGESDIYMLSYDSAGNELWTLHSGGANIDDLSCISLSADGGTLYISGTVQSGPAKFGTVSVPGNLSGSGFLLTLEATKVSGLASVNTDNSILNVYPNPAHDMVNVRLNGIKNTTASIYDLQGKLLKTQYLQEGDHTISLSGIKSGLYLLNVTDDSGKHTMKLQVE